MDVNDTPEQAALRAEMRAWLEENFPAWKREHGITELPSYDRALLGTWQRRLHDGGWAVPHWPAEYGGRGFGPVESIIWSQEKSRVGADTAFNIVGYGMAGPTIIAHGRDEQKARYLPPMMRGDEIWCQLFSEPGAGSDLASLTTRAAKDGDSWVADGQKVWSSSAHEADWGILLTRYDFDVPKHQGLVFFVVDMRSPGIEVRPLRQMDGESHFNEVFLSDVRIPDENRLGEPGEGWRVAITTLMNERLSIGSATGGYITRIERLLEMARRDRADGLTRQRLARVYSLSRILDFLNYRIISKLQRGQIPTAEGSVSKLVLGDLASSATELTLDMLGPRGMLLEEKGLQRWFLSAPAFHIGGGTDAIQRNLIGERVLGLPREPRDDKNVPFSETRLSRP